MTPMTSLNALLSSPTASSNNSTIHANGKTLPDISLGSLGSSFRSDDDEDHARRPAPANVSRAPNLPVINSPETSNSPSIATPSPTRPIASALLSLSPPQTVRRSSSHSVLPDSQAPRRNRILRKNSSTSISSSDVDGPLNARYGSTDMDDEESESQIEVLSNLSLNITPGRKGVVVGRGGRGYGGPSRRGGRHSVAADTSGNGPLTLRDQEQQLNAAKKDIFNLQLENHFLKERLSNMAPDHIEAALKENVRLKLEILNLSKEMKKVKKLLTQQDRDLAEAIRERDAGAGSKGGGHREVRELEGMYKAEKERRKATEEEVALLQEEAEKRDEQGGGEDVDALKAKVEDSEASEAIWRQRVEELEEELENTKAGLEDKDEEMDKLQDTADRALEEVERLKAGLGESVGLGRGREARMVQKLEEEKATLQAELDAHRRGLSGADADELEERVNELRDKLAAAQLDLDRRDSEIEQLNEELDTKIREHDKEVDQVEAEWRNEVLEARAQIDDLKDALEAREQDAKDLKEVLVEREEELVLANDKVAELQAAQNETHDQLEETLKNIERDNAEKDADLIAANREIEVFGQRVYELEENVEDLRAREQDLTADLRSADEAFENAKTHYENLVNALKEARKKLQTERDEALGDVQAGVNERNALRRERAEEVERHRKLLADREAANGRLQADLEAARDRVSQKDKDLSSIQSHLRGLEDERRKLGDEHTSNRFGLELEMDRVRRDLERSEEDLERARGDVESMEARLRTKDLEIAAMLDKQRDLETKLASERQGRLNLSDKLDLANKNARQHERDAGILRDRVEELEPLLTETQQERFQLQKQFEQQRQERSELLLRVFKDVNRFLGTDDNNTPANFAVFRDTLLNRLRAMSQIRTDFEKRVKETEQSVDQRMGALKKQLEQKWRAVDGFEASVKKLELTKMSWKSKYAIKEGELEALKSRNVELIQQVTSLKAGSVNAESTQSRSLSERATSAEKRATNSSNQLALLEARIAEMQSKAGQAESKWEARVREYENRLRVAGEKIKTEKQGGRARAQELEVQVMELERQVDAARRRNARAEGVVASAAHLVPSSSDNSY